VGRDITLEQNPGEKAKRLWDSLKHVT